MGHFELGHWTDFVRGLAPDDRRIAMEHHLSGCAECQATVSFVTLVTRVAAATPRVEVPASLVEAAKAVFPAPQRAAVPSLRRLAARLTFAPFLEPLPTGVRSEYRPVRQALYQAGNYSVDLRVDSERDVTAVTLVGQIANRMTPDEKLAHIPVILKAGKRVVCETVSNDFGEFCLEYKPVSNLRLCLPVQKSGLQVEVSLNRLMAER
jgi:hypothetical protein